ncbi:MAG TPA: hypothetical protein VNJ01_04270 [Bacteriovoracaceae bacterium]|nr:hypothetical protein [Bacteriovoracaceae bacterium]
MISITPYMMGQMNSVTHTITHFFLLAFAFGTQLFGPVVSTKLTGVGFYKLGSSIVIGALVFAAGVDYFMKPGLGSYQYLAYGVIIGSNVLGSALHRDEKSYLMWGLYLVQILSFCFLAFSSFQFDPLWIMFFMFSMVLLGISNFSMLLGHYYLVVPKLSEEPLVNCLYIFWVAFFLKIVSSFAIIFSLGVPYLQEGSTAGDGYVYNWLFVSMRYLWGFAAPVILSIFTFKLCRLRSIQSATGVLYIIEFFVIVGEMISVYLMAKHGLPL